MFAELLSGIKPYPRMAKDAKCLLQYVISMEINDYFATDPSDRKNHIYAVARRLGLAAGMEKFILREESGYKE